MRLATEVGVEDVKRPRRGGSPQAIYNPTDVERMASHRAAKAGMPFIMPKEPETGTLATASPAAQMGGAIATVIAEQFSRMLPSPAAVVQVSLAEKPRVTLREAVQLGYRASDLVERVKAGTLENVGTPHRYSFRRRDLDAL